MPSRTMAVEARKIPNASWPKDFPTSGRWLTIKNVNDIAIHIATPPHRAVGTLCISRSRTDAIAPKRRACFLTKGVIK